ncbi:Methionine--tRNA ligase [Gossypium australe]|uniref:Methionine--tRNA ligase n=1 Tax=Gossypium australe TaxID=47621 RepID=A0A5B6VX04_9ROSI|nr:Methionine--tRNA ligase [Gossypium australe]
MGKLVQDLKKGFCHMVEAFTSCKCYKDSQGNENGEELKIQSSEKGSIQQRGMRLQTAKGPTRPTVPKGPPAQTS